MLLTSTCGLRGRSWTSAVRGMSISSAWPARRVGGRSQAGSVLDDRALISCRSTGVTAVAGGRGEGARVEVGRIDVRVRPQPADFSRRASQERVVTVATSGLVPESLESTCGQVAVHRVGNHGDRALGGASRRSRVDSRTRKRGSRPRPSRCALSQNFHSLLLSPSACRAVAASARSLNGEVLASFTTASRVSETTSTFP